MYDIAGPRCFSLEKDKEQHQEEPEAGYTMAGPSSFSPAAPVIQYTEDMYEALLPSQGATKTSSPERDVQSGSDTAGHIYSQVVKVRNTIPYQSPPNGEKEIYSTLKHKIYVHLDRKSVHLDQQIGVG